MHLTKHHGLGNDFLVLVDLAGTRPVGPALARALCDRHRGIGADGLLRVTRGSFSPGAVCDVTMELYNADGGRAKMSGNGISCLAQAVVMTGVTIGPTVRVGTDAGLRSVTLAPAGERGVHYATVDMGPAKVGDEETEWLDENVLHAVRVDVGNPHLVLHVPDLDAVDLVARGAQINELVPGGINVEAITPGPEPGAITMRVYERGVGITEACGTGACAVAAAAVAWELAGAETRIHQPGGDTGIVVGDTIEMTVPVVHIATIDVAV